MPPIGWIRGFKVPLGSASVGYGAGAAIDIDLAVYCLGLAVSPTGYLWVDRSRLTLHCTELLLCTLTRLDPQWMCIAKAPGHTVTVGLEAERLVEILVDAARDVEATEPYRAVLLRELAALLASRLTGYCPRVNPHLPIGCFPSMGCRPECRESRLQAAYLLRIAAEGALDLLASTCVAATELKHCCRLSSAKLLLLDSSARRVAGEEDDDGARPGIALCTAVDAWRLLSSCL